MYINKGKNVSYKGPIIKKDSNDLLTKMNFFDKRQESKLQRLIIKKNLKAYQL